MSTHQPEPGVYAKGDKTRVAANRAAAVKAVYDGFKPVEEAAEESTRVELQEQAKSLGVPAGGKNDDIKERLIEVSDDVKSSAPVPTPPKGKEAQA